jgi:hypothetical protein
MAARGSRAVSAAYVAVAGAAFAAFVVGSILLATTLPYHVWDAYSFGDWSRHIAGGEWLDPRSAGVVQASRPLFFFVQGGLWAITGISFTTGRLLSLGFAVVLLLATAAAGRLAGRRVGAPALCAALAALVIIAIPAFTEEAVAGDTDVPAAATVAVCAWLALRRSATIGSAISLAAACALALLTKPTTIAAVVGLGVWMLVDDDVELGDRVRRSVIPMAAGAVVGLAYLTWMASRFHTWLLPFLRTAATEGIWGHRADVARPDAVMRLDVAGGALRLPLAFALVYGAARAIGLAPRRAYALALPIGLLWALAGPIAAGDSSPFASAEQGFAFVGFAAVLSAGIFSEEDQAAPRRLAAGAFAFGMLPLAAWAWASPEIGPRLAATAWPGLAILLTLSLLPGIRVLMGLGPAIAIAPVTALAAAAWIAVSGLDGLHGHQWVEYRSLGWSGLGDDARTTNIVLPQLQEALAAVEPIRGGGKVSAWDPRFSWFLPGGVDQEQALRCSDLRNDSVFVELTDDEAVESARLEHGLASVAEWQRCRRPTLRLVTDTISGYAIFKVG